MKMVYLHLCCREVVQDLARGDEGTPCEAEGSSSGLENSRIFLEDMINRGSSANLRVRP